MQTTGRPANLDRMRVTAHEAQSRFEELIRAAERGQEVIIEQAGVPVARLVPFRSDTNRVLGIWRGQIEMSDDFDAPLDADDLNAWER